MPCSPSPRCVGRRCRATAERVAAAIFVLVALTAATMPSPVRSASPLVVVLCADEMMCNGFAYLGGLNYVASVDVTTTQAEASDGAAIAAPPPPQGRRAATGIDAVMLKVLTPTVASGNSNAELGASDSAIFFALVAGIEAARERVGANTSVTMLLVPPLLVGGAATAAHYLDVPYMLVYHRPLPNTVTANGEAQSIRAASGDELRRGSIQYALGGTAYVVGAVAAEMSSLGAVALFTGPLREPSASIHVYVRASFRSHCSTCTLRTFYLDPDVMGNASKFVAALVASDVVDYVDLLLIEASTQLTQAIRALLFNATLPRLSQLTVLCILCDNGATQVTMQPAPLMDAINKAHSSAATSSDVDVAFGFESGVGVSLAPTCATCLSERALRTYADTTTALATLFETQGGFAGVEDALLSLPLAQRTDGDDDRWVATVVHMFADDPGAVPLASIKNSSSSTTTSAIGTAAIASTCSILNQIEQAAQTDDGEAECVMVLVSEELFSVVVLQSGWVEWVSPERRVRHSDSLTSWLNSNAVGNNNIPMQGFSVDAISRNQFIVFGGQRATELLPVPQNAMFLLTFFGTSPASFASVELSILSPSQDVPAARAFHAHVVALRGGDGLRSVYIHGGKGAGEAILSDLWVYSVLDKSWRALTPSGTQRFLHTMLFLPRRVGTANDDVLIVWNGQNLFPLDTAEQFSVLRGSWLPAVDIPIRSTACAVPLGSTHIAFLERRHLTPCVLDALSWTFDCAASDVNVASVLQAQHFQQENYLSSLYCAGVNARRRSNNTVGVVVVPSAAVSSADVALAVVHAGFCPIPVVFDNTTTAGDAAATVAAPSEGVLASPGCASSSAGCPAALPTTPLSAEAYVQQCASYCSVGSFPFQAVCWPCDAATATSVADMWPWTNITVPMGSEFFVTRAAACSASGTGSTSSPTMSVVTPVVIAIVLFVCGMSIGYFIWTLLFHPGNDKDLANAPLLPPITLVQVDVHGSAALWRTDPAFHAQFLDEFYVSVHDAIVACNAFHVRRVGDGILIACRTGVHAVRLIQVIRLQLRERLRHSVKRGKLRACMQRQQRQQTEGGATGLRAGDGDVSMPQGIRAEADEATTVQQLLHTVKCAVHTTSCLYVRRGVAAMEYEGDELLIPNAVLHGTKSGEVSLTLDAISELEGLHRRHVVTGAHLRRGKKDTEFAEVTMESILASLSPPPTTGGGGLPATSAAVEGGGGHGSSSASRCVADRRVCLDGTHIKVLKMACLEPPTPMCKDAAPSTSIVNIVSSLSHTIHPPRPGVTSRDDAGAGNTAVTASAASVELSLAAAAAASHGAVGTIASAAAAATGGPDDLSTNPIHRQLGDFYEYLDDVDMQTHADVSVDEFGAMRQIVAQILRAAILSLNEDLQSDLMKDFRKYFVLATMDRSGADDLVAKSQEGRKIFLFDRLAGRVMHILQPVRAKRHLLLCALAGKTAADLGVGDISTTQNASR